MFDLAFAQVVQVRPPLPVLLQILGDVLREENVSGIATVHYPLRDVDPGAGNVPALIYVGNFMHRPAVNAHPDREAGMRLQRLADFQSALDRRFR